MCDKQYRVIKNYKLQKVLLLLVEMVMELQEVLTLVAVEEAVASLVDLPLVVQAVVV